MVEAEFMTTLKELDYFRTNLEIEKHMRENAVYRIDLLTITLTGFAMFESTTKIVQKP